MWSTWRGSAVCTVLVNVIYMVVVIVVSIVCTVSITVVSIFTVVTDISVSTVPLVVAIAVSISSMVGGHCDLQYLHGSLLSPLSLWW